MEDYIPGVYDILSNELYNVVLQARKIPAKLGSCTKKLIYYLQIISKNV